MQMYLLIAVTSWASVLFAESPIHLSLSVPLSPASIPLHWSEPKQGNISLMYENNDTKEKKRLKKSNYSGFME